MATGALQGQLLQSARSEHAGGFEAPSIAEVYQAEFDYVFRCLRSLGVRPDLLDDALQDVFLVVQAKLERFDGRARLRTWLYAIVLRVARRYRERVAKEARRFVCDADAPQPDAAAQAPSDPGKRMLARQALAALDRDKREVFVLSAVEQLSAPEIAEVTGLPVNTVYSRIRAARLAFAEQVARIEGHTHRGGTDGPPDRSRSSTRRKS